MLDIKYVVGEDWEGIYIHNVLAYEGHRIRFKDGFDTVCKHINEVESAEYIQFSTYDIDQDWLEDKGSLPEKFENIPSELLEEWTS